MEILGRGRKEALLAGGTGARRPNPDETGIGALNATPIGLITGGL